MIGADVWVTLLEIDRNKVRLGIEAPRGTPIMRKELLEPKATKPTSLDDVTLGERP